MPMSRKTFTKEQLLSFPKSYSEAKKAGETYYQNTCKVHPDVPKYTANKTCMGCLREKMKHYNEKRAEKMKSDPNLRRKRRDRDLRRTYGISVEIFDEILRLQGNCCAICKSKETASKRVERFFVDHNHLTGKVRGILCHKCNTAIGLLNCDEGTDLLDSAYKYIKLFQ